MKRASVVFLGIIALIACASTHMKQYVGKDIREVLLDSGPPNYAFDMPDGTRAFQFRWGGGTYVVPQSTTTTGTVTAVGDSAWYQSHSITTGGGVVTSEGCILTYITEWDEKRHGWIVIDYRYPKRLFC